MVRTTTTTALMGLSAAVLFSSTAHAWDHLSKDKFHETIRAHSLSVVAYIHPGDKGDAALEAEWDLVKPETTVPLFSVDCSAAAPDGGNDSICPTDGLPVISMLEQNSVRSTYPGARRASAILQWISRAELSSPLTYLSTKSLQSFKTGDETVCIAFVDEDNAEHQNLHDVWKHSIASPSQQQEININSRRPWSWADRISLGIITNATTQALTEESIKSADMPAVKCWLNPEKKLKDDADSADGSAKTNKHLAKDNSKTLSGSKARKADAAAVQEFIVDATRPIIGELVAANYYEYLNRGWPIVYIFANTESERASLRATLSGSALNYAGSLSAVTVDPFTFPDLQEQFGLVDPSSPDDSSASGPVPGNKAQPGKAVGVLVQPFTGNIWHYPEGQGFTVGDLMSWGLKVKLGLQKPIREADPDWMWPKKEGEEEAKKGAHDEL